MAFAKKVETELVGDTKTRAMLPSPSSRRSPARELRTVFTHKRGRSFESALLSRAKDDDLVLFNEMHNRKRDSFLLHTSDDFDDFLTKLRHFSDFKFGFNIPARGERGDLLVADTEKNDYDWLLTPPDTPLFPSLDDDGHQPLNISRGRTRRQAISVAKPSLSEMAPRTSRSSASPHRLSPIPRSSYNAAQSKARPSSVPRSSPPPLLRSSTPTRRPSPPTNVATPAARSSTSTMRRMSTGSSGTSFSSGVRGNSPGKPTRGNSASPKLRGWQTDLAGFPTDTPPNLRTSLSDRATSRARGFSPASSTSSGIHSSLKFGRKSTSPSASSNASLSLSLERDNSSSYTRISVASSGDDDADSILSVNVGLPNSCAVRKYGAFANSKPVVLSKKNSRSLSGNSALKTSFVSAARQLENRKAPQKMFRPLLSSLPASTFYVGKPNSTHQTLVSRNSSVTISSSGSSEQGPSIAPEIEYTDQNENNLPEGPEIEEEVFTFDKLDAVRDINDFDTHAGNVSSFERKFGLITNNEITCQELETSAGNIVQAANKETMGTCSKCGNKFLIEIDEMQDICDECAAIDGILASEELETAITSTENENALNSPVHFHIPSHKLPVNKSNEVKNIQNETKWEQGAYLYRSTDSVMSTKEVRLCKDIDQEKENIDEFSGRCKSRQSEPAALQGFKVDNPEGTGISVLLMQKPDSSKWPVVHGRTFSASNVLCSEPPYARDSENALRHRFGREISPSSSDDLASSRQIEGCSQFSIREVEMDNIWSNNNVLIQSTDSHSETSANTMVSLIDRKTEHEEGSFSTSGIIESDLASKWKKLGLEKHNLNASANINVLECFPAEHAIKGDDISAYSGTSNSSGNLCSQLNQPSSIQLYDNPASNSDSRNHSSHEYPNIEKYVDTEQQITNPTPSCSFNVDNLVLSCASCQSGIPDDATYTSLVTSQHQGDHICYEEGFMNESMPAQVPDDTEDYQEACNSTKSDRDDMLTTENKDILAITEETAIPEHLADEEPSTLHEDPKRVVQRSFTMEEATDTILICSSIAHDIAYKAVMIGMEKELALSEIPRPMVTILGKSVPNQYLRNIPSNHAQSSRKVKRKRPEIDIKVQNMDLGECGKVHETAHTSTKVINTVDSTRPPRLESKCNCSVM